MPYIKNNKRLALKQVVEKMNAEVRSPEFSVGDLNYLITNACVCFLYKNDTFNYADINSITGVLECAKLEFYRRVAADYEDIKIKESGDVY